ncbi:MAG: hypothetical protein RR982_04710, partial [Kiritimatiellia bacterium]
MQNTIPIVDWSLTQREESVERFLQRPTFDVSAEAAATKCLTEIRTQGVEAVLNACRLFDGATLTRETMRISD